MLSDRPNAVLSMLINGGSADAVLGEISGHFRDISAEVAVLLLQADTGKFEPHSNHATGKILREYFERPEASDPECAWSQAALHRKRVVVKDLGSGGKGRWARELAEAGMTACWAQPFFSQLDEVAGAIVLLIRDTEMPTGEIAPVIDDACALATIAIRHERAARELEERQVWLEGLLNNSRDAIYIHVNRRIVYANPAMDEMFGFETTERAIGMRSIELVHPDDRATILARQTDEIAKGRASEFREFRFLRRDGQLFHAESLGSPIVWRGLPAVMVMVRDLSDRKRTEEELRESTARLRSITENVPGLVYQRVMKPDGTIEYPAINDGVREICGYTPEQVMADPKLLLDLIHPEDRDGYYQALRHSADTLTPMPIDFRLYHPDKGVKWVHGASRPRKRGDGAIVWDALMMDITSRKEMEQELSETRSALERRIAEYLDARTRLESRSSELAVTAQQLQIAKAEAERSQRTAETANMAKSEFLATMSHEIRTPMNGMLGMAEMLLEGDLNHDQRDQVTVIRDCGQALLTIINDILDLSKMESGHLELENIPFGIHEAIDGVVHLLGSRAVDKGLELSVVVHPDVPARLVGDPGRLRQVLINLVGNAIKFTERGGVTVTARLGEPSDDGIRLRFEVADTGIGIPAEAQEYLFDRFTQVDASTTRKFGGTGLGLAISRQICELLGGNIGVRSEPETGSTFHFTVVLAEERDVDDPRGPVLDALDGKVALVVAGEGTGRDALAAQLSAWGMEVVTAVDRTTALKLAERDPEGPGRVAVALIDHRLPGASGLSLGADIRREHGKNGPALVLISELTGRSLSKLVEQSGFDACLTKPLRLSAFLERLAEIFVPDRAEAIARGAQGGSAKVNASAAVTPLRILVAEDNAINQKVVSAMLSAGGHRIDIVDDGAHAVEAVQRADYDIVLMDVHMPEMDGPEATRRIRALPGDASRVPIVAVTADAMHGDREKYLEAGMDDYVTKPIDQAELFRAVARHCGAASGQAVLRGRPEAPPDREEPRVQELDELGAALDSFIAKG